MNLKVSFLCLFLITLLILPTGVALAAEDAIAVVIAAEGSSYVRRDGRDIPLELKDRLLVNDTILTGADGKVQLLFNDNSAISVGSDSLLELREFVDAGAQSKFDAHLENGALRIITGWLTEANPAGFKMTTPLGTIGIRGTMLTVKTTDQQTTVSVSNTNKIVIVNDVNLMEGHKAVLNRGQVPIVSKIEPGERERDDNEFSFRARGVGLRGIKPKPLEDDSVDLPENGGLMTDLTEHPLISASSTNATVAGQLGLNSISSTYSINNFSGSFSCNIDLQTGQVTNAAMSGSGTGYGITLGNVSLDFAFSGGSGSLTANSYNISGWSDGHLKYDNNATPISTHIDTTVPGDFNTSTLNINSGSSNFANLGDPTGSGSQFQIIYLPNVTLCVGGVSGERIY